MTDQLKTAMADYPDELRVVMERAGYTQEDEDGDYIQPLAMDGTYATSPKSVYTTSLKGERIVCHYATDNDAIVAALEWLMDEAAMYMYTGDWRDVQCFKNRYGLLIALLIVVRDAMA